MESHVIVLIVPSDHLFLNIARIAKAAYTSVLESLDVNKFSCLSCWPSYLLSLLSVPVKEEKGYI